MKDAALAAKCNADERLRFGGNAKKMEGADSAVE